MREKLNILMAMPKKGLWGGPAGHLPYLAAGLRAQNIKVVEVLYGSRSNKPVLFQRLIYFFKSCSEIIHALKREQFDIIHLNSAFDYRALVRDALVLLWIKKYRVKVFIKFHGSDCRLLGVPGLHGWFIKNLTRVLISYTAAIGVLSQEEAENMQKAGFEKSRILVVKNILKLHPVAKFATADEFKKHWKIKSETAILLFAARFIPEKGLFDLIQACIKLREDQVPFVLVCAGDGPCRQEAETLVEALCLSEQVFFTGYLSEAELAAFYRYADLMVLPTYHQEGFPMAIFHAVASGLPVITTRIRAAADYLREPAHCLWVGARQPELLAERIRFLLMQPRMRERMSDNNRTLAAQFSEENVVAEYLDIYRCLRAPTAAH